MGSSLKEIISLRSSIFPFSFLRVAENEKEKTKASPDSVNNPHKLKKEDALRTFDWKKLALFKL